MTAIITSNKVGKIKKCDIDHEHHDEFHEEQQGWRDRNTETDDVIAAAEIDIDIDIPIQHDPGPGPAHDVKLRN